MEYSLTEQAKADIAEIFEYGLIVWGQPAAERYYDKMFDAFAAIGNFPKSSRERDEAGNGMRLKVYRSHLIIFRLDESEPLIVRIVHGSYNWQGDY